MADNLKAFQFFFAIIFGGFLFLDTHAFAYNVAPGAPGIMITWPRPDKDAVGTTLHRGLWFTTVKGGLNEIAFPYVDRVQTKDSYLVIRSGNKIYDERYDTELKTARFDHSLAYSSQSSHSDLSIQKTFFVHPNQDTIIIDYKISFADSQDRELIFVHHPTAEQTSGGDEMLVEPDGARPVMFAYQRDLRGDEPSFLLPIAHQSVSWSINNSKASTGFYGVNSPADQIQRGAALLSYTQASYGDVVGALSANTSEKTFSFRVVLSFTVVSAWKKRLNEMNNQALLEDSTKLIDQQSSEWLSYLGPLMFDRRDPLSEASILILKSAEDKTNPGAIIAAPANPSIPWNVEAMEHPYEDARRRVGDANAGYRRVWPRDLFHKSLAFISVGDYATAIDIVRWYRKVQLKEFRAGSWAQNMRTDGTPSWNAFQVDQTGFPIVLVRRLVELKQISYAEFRDMVVKAANFIMVSGPATDQDRWEENGGLSPNSMAAAVEGLLAAAVLEKEFGDANLGRSYEERGNYWISNLKSWTLVRNGHFGQYYFPRLEIGRNGIWRPDSNDEVFIQNKAPGMRDKFYEDEILDGGFLQWIIAGLVDPFDKDFSHTIQIYDENVRKDTIYGKGYLRYNHDSYGEDHVGGIWPILSAERAIVAIERKEDYSEHLSLIRSMATPTGLIGEQDTLSVRPLEWSHAAYLILVRSARDGRSFYKNQISPAVLSH